MVAFKIWKHFHYYLAAHDLVEVPVVERYAALPVFHAFIDCNTVSFFVGRGQKTVWHVWMAYDTVTAAFSTLAATPDTESIDDCMPILEQFVVLL